MQGNGRYAIGAILVMALGLLTTGCPREVGTALFVSPERLDFGATTEELSFKITRNFSSSALDPITVQASQPWIVPGACTDPAQNCLSAGPIDGLRIPVRINRQGMELGANVGTITIFGNGASVQTVEVLAEDDLKADFDASSRTADVGRGITFTDLSASSGPAIVSRLWSFGDGTTSASMSPVHSYQAAGQYDVSLTVRTAKGHETITKPAFMTVGSPAPSADFYASATNVFEGAILQFTDRSTSSAAPIIRRAWNFGDGRTSAETNPTHQYLTKGVYTVSLTVHTAYASHTTTRPGFIIVQQKIGPTAHFALSQAKPFIGIPVSFTDLSEPGTAPINRWIWEFGDGIASTEQNPTHTYSNVGVFQVKLTVVTAHGVNTKTVPVEVVYMPPTADFEADVLDPSTGEEVSFTDLSLPGTLPVATWVWDFGDNTRQTIVRNPGVVDNGNTTHSYTRAGTYTVTLAAMIPVPANNTDIEIKEDYIVVIDPPKVDFEISTRNAVINKEVRFTNLTEPGAETPLTYEWNFGDRTGAGNTSADTDGRHTYVQPGVYSVTLTAITPTRRVTSAPKTVTVDAPPTPNFTFSPAQPTSADTVQFQDASTAINTRPIAGRLWDFDDGQQSASLNPTHRFTVARTYNVALRLTFIHSGSGQSVLTDPATRAIVVSQPNPPQARFRVESPCAITSLPVQFVDLSTRGSRPITAWLWDFGNGSASSEQSPSFRYPLPGTYTVTLTVRSSDGLEDTTERRDYIVVSANNDPLDRFVRTRDANYAWTTPTTQEISVSGQRAGTAYLTRMTSQAWRSAAEVYEGRIWSHNLTIINPATRRYDTALLYIDGGSRTSSPPSASELQDFATLAALSGTVIAWIDNVPSQPMVFNDEVENGVILNRRTEDAIIAYSYDKFMTEFAAGNTDNDWPALFPMAKAAVRAMDTVQTILEDIGPPADFIVSGGSKRGWTTWLAGLTDCRIRAIAPIVIDVLNMDKHMEHHRNAYGYWAPSIYEYAQMKVFDRLLQNGSGTLLPEAEALLKLVDPYEYRTRMSSIPKFLMNSTGDEFFLPDSAQWYFADLPGEKYINYVPNTSHGLVGSLDLQEAAVGNLFGWYLAETQNRALPQFTYSFETNGAIRVQIPDISRLKGVKLWQATNPSARDFRKYILDPLDISWTSADVLPVTPDGKTFLGNPGEPQDGWTGYFLQLTFQNPAAFSVTVPGVTVPDLVFTTPIRIIPDAYPVFNGVRSDISGIPFVKLYGDARTMGEQYGRLMPTEINAFLPGFVTSSGFTTATLDAAWTQQAPLMDPRIIDELLGIQAGSGIAFNTLSRAQMVDVLKTYGASYSSASASAWGTATGLPTAFGIAPPLLQSYTLNIPLATGARQNFPCVVMYVPTDGFPHVNFTSAGLTFAHAGLSSAGLSLTDIPDANGGAPITQLHYLPAFREIMYEANSLRNALGLVQDLMPARNHHYLIGDGRFEIRGAKVRRDSSGYSIWLDNDPADEFAPSVLPKVLYSTEPAPAAGAYFLLNSGYGALNNTALRTFAQSFGKSGQNTLNVVMNTTAFSAEAAYASALSEAFNRPFVSFDFQAELP